MTRVWRAWVELWDRREEAAALAAVRICVGLVLLYDYVEIWRLDLASALFTTDGFAKASGGWGAALGAHGLLVVAACAAAGIALGALTRVACVVFVLASAQLALLSPNGDRGIDVMLRIVVGVLALSKSHARWSVDALVRARIGRPIATDVPAWPRYLLLVQLVWVYFSGGLNKGGASWGPHGGFSALANVLADPHMARFDPAWLEIAMPATRVASALTMLFELGAPLLVVAYYCAATRERGGRLRVFVARLRWVWIALGLAFHLGIALGMRLGIFPWGMLALYPVLLLPAEISYARRKVVGPANRASSPS